MPKVEESLNEVSLRYILDTEEIEGLKKYPIFQNIEDNEFCYDKKELLLKFVTLAIDKFIESKDEILAKCFKWVQLQLQMNLEIKPDAYSLNRIKTMESGKPSMKMKIGWLKEYSTLSKDNHLFTMFGKHLNKVFQRYSKSIYKKNVEKSNETKKKKTPNTLVTSSSILNKLNGEENYYLIQDVHNHE